MVMLTTSIAAQNGKGKYEKFSPQKFEAELQAFITKEAGLTAVESAKFFPLYKEMQSKQRQLFEKQRRNNAVKPADEQGCRKAIMESDALDIEIRQIQQTYHKRFLELLPASKVYDILKAEERFHRRMMKNWGRGGNGNHPSPHQK